MTRDIAAKALLMKITIQNKNTNMKLSIIIPVYNEYDTIKHIVSTVHTQYPDSEIIVVDDGSTDNSGRAAKDAGAIVYSHPYNIGNGAAVKTGIRHATGDMIVLMDGDGQHKPDDIESLISQMDQYDMVVGARIHDAQSSKLRRFGNLIYNRIASYVANFKIMDLTSGFRAIRTKIAKRYLYLLPNTYSYPTTLTLCIIRSGRRLKYVPIQVDARKTGKSQIKIHKDGIRFMMIILKLCTFYSPLRIFIPTSIFLFVSGLCYYMFTYLSYGRFTNMSALLLTTALIIFMIGLVSEQICQLRFDRSEDIT